MVWTAVLMVVLCAAWTQGHVGLSCDEAYGAEQQALRAAGLRCQLPDQHKGLGGGGALCRVQRDGRCHVVELLEDANWGSSPLTAVEFPHLTRAKGLMFKDNRALESVSLPLLQTIDTPSTALGLSQNPALTALVLPALRTVESGAMGVFVADNAALTTVQFGQLQSVTATNTGLMIARNPALTSLSLGTLASVSAGKTGLYVGENARLEHLDAARLEDVQAGSEAIGIFNNSELVSFSFSKLLRVSGGRSALVIVGNPLLDKFAFPSLRDIVGGELGLFIQGCPMATEIGLPNVTLVSGRVYAMRGTIAGAIDLCGLQEVRGSLDLRGPELNTCNAALGKRFEGRFTVKRCVCCAGECLEPPAATNKDEL